MRVTYCVYLNNNCLLLSGFLFIAFFCILGENGLAPALNAAFEQLGSETFCWGAACDRIPCEEDWQCPDTYVCDGINRDGFGSSRRPFQGGAGGFFGAGGLGLSSPFGSTYATSGGILGGWPALNAGIRTGYRDAGVGSSVGINWPIRASIRYCIPYALQRPPNVISLGGEATNPLVHQLPMLGSVPLTPTMLLMQTEPSNFAFPPHPDRKRKINPKLVHWRRDLPDTAKDDHYIYTESDDHEQSQQNKVAQFMADKNNWVLPGTAVPLLSPVDSLIAAPESDISEKMSVPFVWKADNVGSTKEEEPEIDVDVSEIPHTYINHQGRFVRLARASRLDPSKTKTLKTKPLHPVTHSENKATVLPDFKHEDDVEADDQSISISAVKGAGTKSMEAKPPLKTYILPQKDLDSSELDKIAKGHCNREAGSQARRLQRESASEHDESMTKDQLHSFSPELFPLNQQQMRFLNFPNECKGDVLNSYVNYEDAVINCLTPTLSRSTVMTAIQNAMMGLGGTPNVGRRLQLLLNNDGSEENMLPNSIAHLANLTRSTLQNLPDNEVPYALQEELRIVRSQLEAIHNQLDRMGVQLMPPQAQGSLNISNTNADPSFYFHNNPFWEWMVPAAIGQPFTRNSRQTLFVCLFSTIRQLEIFGNSAKRCYMFGISNALSLRTSNNVLPPVSPFTPMRFLEVPERAKDTSSQQIMPIP